MLNIVQFYVSGKEVNASICLDLQIFISEENVIENYLE